MILVNYYNDQEIENDLADNLESYLIIENL